MKLHLPFILAARIGTTHPAPFDRLVRTVPEFGRKRFKAKEGHEHV